MESTELSGMRILVCVVHDAFCLGSFIFVRLLVVDKEVGVLKIGTVANENTCKFTTSIFFVFVFPSE